MSKTKLKVIKIGGNIIDNPSKLEQFLTNLSQLKEKFVLIHGGGKIATEMSKSMGLEAQMINGRRVTDEATLKIVTMVYAGWINKNIVAQLQSKGINALGLTGPDGQIVLSKKRNPEPINYGWVGDIIEVKSEKLKVFIENGFNPIIAPITADLEGNLLNTNADTMAQAIAIGLSPFYEVELSYCFEKPGVLMNANDDDSVISQINETYFMELKEKGIVNEGMIPKLENALKAISEGV
ncbi:MAG: Acetylglutamate kinase, partial [Bacteroidota bacterium]